MRSAPHTLADSLEFSHLLIQPQADNQALSTTLGDTFQTQGIEGAAFLEVGKAVGDEVAKRPGTQELGIK